MEPGARIDVKPPFLATQFRGLLSLQSDTNTILSQILDSFQAILETPEKDPHKVVYHEELKMLHSMVENVGGPLTRLASVLDRTTGEISSEEATILLLRNLRRFKKADIEQTVQNGFDQLREYSTAMQAADKAVMVEQAFVLQLCAVSWSLSELCGRFQHASTCFENIASSYPQSYCINSLARRPSHTDSEQPLQKEKTELVDGRL